MSQPSNQHLKKAEPSSPIPINDFGVRGSEHPLSQVPCPGCGRLVIPTAVACPDCGEAVFVEHPADILGVKHPPLNLPPADRDAYGPPA